LLFIMISPSDVLFEFIWWVLKAVFRHSDFSGLIPTTWTEWKKIWWHYLVANYPRIVRGLYLRYKWINPIYPEISHQVGSPHPLWPDFQTLALTFFANHVRFDLRNSPATWTVVGKKFAIGHFDEQWDATASWDLNIQFLRRYFGLPMTTATVFGFVAVLFRAHHMDQQAW
jgi:hypothetical protein